MEQKRCVVLRMKTDLIACDFAPTQCDSSTRFRDGIAKQRNFIPEGVFYKNTPSGNVLYEDKSI